jgi:hypothetical protein
MKMDGIRIWLLVLFAFFLPIWQQISVVALICLLLYVFVSGKWKESVMMFRNDKVLWLFSSFYAIHIFGMLYSSNYDYGLFDLQVKLSYFIFPLFFSSVLTGTEIRRSVRLAFIAGNTVAAVICMLFATGAFLQDGLISHFFYIDYSRFLHTTYFSMYLNLAVIFILLEWFRNDKTSLKNIYPLLALFLMINVMLLYARTALVVNAFTISAFIIMNRKYWRNEKGKLRWILAGILFLSLSQFAIFKINDRFTQVRNVLEHPEAVVVSPGIPADSLIRAEDNSTSTRIRLWQSSLDLIRKNPVLGVGTGDIKDELKQIYLQNNYQYGIRGDLNPHNQFLHTTVMLGMIGLFVLLACLLVPFVMAYRRSDHIYMIFLMIIFLNSMTESILEVQKGVLLMAFFSLLFYIDMKARIAGRKLNQQDKNS